MEDMVSFKVCIRKVKELGIVIGNNIIISILKKITPLTYNFPDRMENPINYQVQLLQGDNQRRISYGTAA